MKIKTVMNMMLRMLMTMIACDEVLVAVAVVLVLVVLVVTVVMVMMVVVYGGRR